MEVGKAAAVGVAVRTGIGVLAALKPHPHQAVELLADVAVADQIHGAVGRLAEVVVQVAAQIQAALRCELHHLARLVDIVRQRFLDQHVFAGVQGLHDRLEVPAAVFGAAGAHIHDVELRMVGQHVRHAAVDRRAILLARRLRALRHRVAHRHQGGEIILVVAPGVPLADSVVSYYADVERHARIVVRRPPPRRDAKHRRPRPVIKEHERITNKSG